MQLIQHLCDRELYSVSAEHTVLDVSRYMAERNIGGVGVMEGRTDGEPRLAGIFTERDLMMRVVARGLDPGKTLVKQVMTPHPVVVDENESVENCLRTMKTAGCRHLPVVSRGKLVGMVSLRDLLQVELENRADEAEMMRSYIHSVPPGVQHE